MLRIGIVVGEPSGDALGAGLIRSLRQYHPDLVVEGVLGPQLIQAGGKAIFPMSKLSVMGLFEVLLEYPDLASIRNRLKHYFYRNPPDVFIGIDSPDFNLQLEEDLRASGIKTVHYVSPSVWAWRPKRVSKVARAADLLLTLFPFESDFYRNESLKLECVGHSMADAIPLQPDTQAARQSLGLPTSKRIIALMPGSRRAELARLSKPFLETAMACYQGNPGLHFVSNVIDAEARTSLEQAVSRYAPGLPLTLFEDQPRETLASCDVALLASGTVTLETMLLKKPMVIAYRMAAPTYYLLRLMVSSRWAGLPNILAQETLVPEYFQGQVRADVLAPALMHWLNNLDDARALINRFTELHREMKLDANEKAAAAVQKLCQQ